MCFVRHKYPSAKTHGGASGFREVRDGTAICCCIAQSRLTELHEAFVLLRRAFEARARQVAPALLPGTPGSGARCIADVDWAGTGPTQGSTPCRPQTRPDLCGGVDPVSWTVTHLRAVG